VVPNPKVNDVIDAIIKVAHTGKKSDGKIFVSDITESVDIATKEKCEE
jgi:nitrogen regulatory protein PII